MVFVKKAILGDMEINFKRALQVVGADEFNVYLLDRSYTIDGLPYVLSYSKEWRLIGVATGCELRFENKID